MKTEMEKLRDALDTCLQFIEAADIADWEPGDQAMATHCIKAAKKALRRPNETGISCSGRPTIGDHTPRAMILVSGSDGINIYACDKCGLVYWLPKEEPR
jgi:hypothetical protein